MARNPRITMPTATTIPSSALPPTGEAIPAAGDNATIKLPPFVMPSDAELDAAWKLSVANSKSVDATAVNTRTQTKVEVKAATRNLMLLTAQKFRRDPAFNGESVCIEINGADKVATWNKRTKAVRFAEWNTVGDAARNTDRVNESLWAIADTKEKFVKACVKLGENKAITNDAIVEALKPAQAKPVSDGQHLADAIASLMSITDQRYILALADTVEGLVEFKSGQNAIGEMLDDEQVKAREAAAKKGGTTTDTPMTWRERVALARAAATQ